MRQPKPPILFSLLGVALAGSAALLMGDSSQAVAEAAVVIAQAKASSPSATTVGGPLAKQLQGKPVVVDIYASWCPACRTIAPTLSKLRQDYGTRVHFVVLDVSDKAKSEQSEAKARQLGLGAFLAANKTQTGMVTIIEPSTGKILAQQRNNPNTSAYTSVLNKALAN
jgi:thiol-disulfide isomerase/thioredoxin